MGTGQIWHVANKKNPKHIQLFNYEINIFIVIKQAPHRNVLPFFNSKVMQKREKKNNLWSPA